jgi:hypothetical protein
MTIRERKLKLLADRIETAANLDGIAVDELSEL